MDDGIVMLGFGWEGVTERCDYLRWLVLAVVFLPRVGVRVFKTGVLLMQLSCNKKPTMVLAMGVDVDDPLYDRCSHVVKFMIKSCVFHDHAAFQMPCF